MIEPAFHFCPQCAEKLTTIDDHGALRQVCGRGHVLYKNQNVTVSAAIFRDGKVLLARRALEPYKGMLDLPGGYVEPDERATNALIREVEEELHVKGEITKLVGFYGPDYYPFKGVDSYNGCVIYKVDIGKQVPRPDDDVASLEWFPLTALPAGREMAFPSHREWLKMLRRT